jgi:hypothetical protein
MPNLDEASGQRPAATVKDESRDGDPLATGRVGIEIAFERGVRSEEGAGFPFERRVAPIIT